MACSICQSMTFQATAGSRLDGSVRYASDIVPPCTGVSDDDGRRREVVRLSFADHLTPRRRRRLYAEADVAERGFEEDGGGDAEAGIDDDRRHEMRQDVAEEDAAIGAADEARGVDELLLADAEHLAVDDARHRRPVDDADHQDDDSDARFEDAYQSDCEQIDGESHCLLYT